MRSFTLDGIVYTHPYDGGAGTLCVRNAIDLYSQHACYKNNPNACRFDGGLGTDKEVFRWNSEMEVLRFREDKDG